MPSDTYSKGKCLRVRGVDVGRKGHHYIKVCVTKAKGKRGGTTKILGGLLKYR